MTEFSMQTGPEAEILKEKYERELLAELFRRMTLVREFELRAIEERRGGLIPGFIHSCVGQEATAVGACLALQKDDVITSTHRGHGHLIGKGGDPRYMMSELAARSPGYCQGRGWNSLRGCQIPKCGNVYSGDQETPTTI